MKKIYQSLTTAVIIFLAMMVPLATTAQTPTKETPKQAAAKTETPKSSKCEKDPSHSYWAITAYGALDQFNGDLSKNLLFNDTWRFGAGASVTKQFSRVFGLRFRGGWVPLAGSVTNKYVPEAFPVGKDGKITQNFKSWVVETSLEGTINWVNWIMGYKPERFFSSYLIVGFGFDHTQGAKYDANGNKIGYLGYPSHLTADNNPNDPTQIPSYGNNSGIGKWNMEFKADAGIGFDFNLSKHWSINPEIIWQSDDTENGWEGCLSIPGLRGLVPRHRRIGVRYQNRNGEIKEDEYADFIARVFQHEFDHLQGIVFIDRMESSLNLMTEKEYLKSL